MADEKVGIALAKESNCAPANEKAYEDADVAANDMIMAMRETAKTAQPMPKHPADERYVGTGRESACSSQQIRG